MAARLHGKMLSRLGGRLRQRWPTAMFLAVTIAFALTGCGASSHSSGGTPPQPAGSSSSSTATAAAPSRVTDAALPNGEVRRNDVTVYSGCTGGRGDGNSSTTRQLFDTSSGKYVAMPAWPTANGDEFVGASCTVTNVAGSPRIIYIVATKTPSQGLTPESTRTQMYSYEPSSSSPAVVKPLDSDFESIVPTRNGFYMISNVNEGQAATLFDAATLDVKAKFPSVYGQSVYVNEDGMALTYESVQYGPMSVHFTSAVDGAEVGVFNDALPGAPVSVADHGFFVIPQDGSTPGVRYFDSQTNQMSEPIALGRMNPIDNDNDSTALPKGSFTNRFSSQYGDDVLLQGNDLAGLPFIKVYDVKANKQLFDLSGQQLVDLKVDDALIGGGPYVFLIKSPDNPVVDISTTKDVSSGWKVRSALKLADGWVLLQTGGEAADGSSHPEFKLVRPASGDYDGPWF